MTNRAKTITRALFALFTAAVLVITFYFPMIGLGYALDSSADLESRGTGLLLLLPSLALLVLLVAMLPVIRGRPLLWWGISGSLLILPPITACCWLRGPGLLGLFAGITYLAAWWRLARTRLSCTSPRA